MNEAILPLLGYLALQIIPAGVGLNIVRDKELHISTLLKAWIMGQMLLYATLQILTVPMILLHIPYKALLWSFFGTSTLLFAFGIKRLTECRLAFRQERSSATWMTILLLTLALLMMLSQSACYFFGIHLDEDDARWLAEANDAVEYGQMMTRSFDTGAAINGFAEYRDVVSPWPMLFSILSQILFTRVSVVAHTLYPTIAVWTFFGVYYLIGTELFEKQEARSAFLFLCGILLFFLGGTSYTQGAFSLIRIWQGKASVAGIVIPLLVYLFIRINRMNQRSDWLQVAMVGAAGCLMSGMGIIISLIMIGVYGFYSIVAYRRWKEIPTYMISVLPSIAFALTYYIIKR